MVRFVKELLKRIFSMCSVFCAVSVTLIAKFLARLLKISRVSRR